MTFFSWKAEKKTFAGSWYVIEGWLPNIYKPCVLFGAICFYKPNRKGGHRHNHIYNACHRITFRSKSARHSMSREDKMRFVATFYTTLMLNPQVLGDILKRRRR